MRGNFYRTSLNNFSSMAKYVDSINTQAATINSLLEDIHSRVSIKSGGSGASPSPPLITDMEKLTILLFGLGDDFSTTREILENDAGMTFEMACMRLKEKAEFISSSLSSSSSSASAAMQSANHVNTSNGGKRPKKRTLVTIAVASIHRSIVTRNFPICGLL